MSLLPEEFGDTVIVLRDTRARLKGRHRCVETHVDLRRPCGFRRYHLPDAGPYVESNVEAMMMWVVTSDCRMVLYLLAQQE